MTLALRMWLVGVTVAVAASAGPSAQQTSPASVRGRIANLSGDPLPRAIVTLTPVTGFSSDVATDDDGRFEFVGLRAGRYRLEVRKSGYGSVVYEAKENAADPEVFVVAGGDREVTINLPVAAAIVVDLTDAAGLPVRNAIVQAFRIGPGNRLISVNDTRRQTDEWGEMRLGGLAPGTYYVGVRTGDARFAPSLYYPETNVVDDAEPLKVMSGEERRIVMTVR